MKLHLKKSLLYLVHKNRFCPDKIKKNSLNYLLDIIIYDKIIYVLIALMNTQLEHLFEKYRLSEKDRYEINQIFDLLPTDKKQNLLNNFDLLVFRIEKIQEEIRIEKEILIWDAITNISNAIERAKRQQVLN